MTEGRAAVSASSSSSSLSSSSSSVTDEASANPNGIQTPAAKTKKRQGSPPSARRSTMSTRLHVGVGPHRFHAVRAHCSAHRCAPCCWGAALSKEHSTDLTPLLSCSEVIVRDPAHPYGPSKKANECARRGEYVVSPKSQL